MHQLDILSEAETQAKLNMNDTEHEGRNVGELLQTGDSFDDFDADKKSGDYWATKNKGMPNRDGAMSPFSSTMGPLGGSQIEFLSALKMR